MGSTMQTNLMNLFFALTFLVSLISVTKSFKFSQSRSDSKGQSLSLKLSHRFHQSRSFSISAKKIEDAARDGGFNSKSNDVEGLLRVEPASSSEETDKGDLNEGLRVKLKEEISSPFRKVRQFVYSGMGLAGALGTITAVPQLLFAVQDGGDAIAGAVGNVAIDVGAVILAVVLWDKDAQEGDMKLDRYARKEKLLSYQMTTTDKEDRERELSLLPVQIQVSEKDENATRIVSLGELQSKGKQNVIIVAGKRDFVQDTVISAKIEGADLFNSKEIYVIPVVLEDDQLEAALAKGFGAPKESLMSAPYIGKPMQINVWEAYLKKETDLAILQGEVNIINKGIVIAVKRDGKVLRRGVGIPPWKVLAEDLQEKVKK